MIGNEGKILGCLNNRSSSLTTNPRLKAFTSATYALSVRDGREPVSFVGEKPRHLVRGKEVTPAWALIREWVA
jgi:hypothetical protein